LNDSSSTFYEASETVPTPTTHIADINSLNDEQVRERFIAVMVRI
jgi:hypothetical protein